MTMDRSARFWDRIAERYSRKPVPDEAVYQQKLGITRKYLNAASQVLEFGCGTGSTAIAHAPHVARILATDISPKMIEIARRKAEAAGVRNVEFEVSAIEDIDAPDGSFDVVLGLSILHLLDDRQAAIARVHRMLKPGGVFVSSTACIGEKMAWFRFVGPLGAALGLIPKVGVFRAEELRRELTDAGFDIETEWRPGNGTTAFVVARKPEA